MGRSLAFAGVLLAALVWASAAVAADIPRARLVKNADLICSYENGKLVQLAFPKGLDDPKKITAKNLRASAAYFAGSLELQKDAARRFAKLGRPREPAIRVAWSRYVTLHTTVAIPALADAVAAARKGDAKAFMASFARGEKYTPEVGKLVKTIGLHVCQWGG
jgi:aminopeptidase N